MTDRIKLIWESEGEEVSRVEQDVEDGEAMYFELAGRLLTVYTDVLRDAMLGCPEGDAPHQEEDGGKDSERLPSRRDDPIPCQEPCPEGDIDALEAAIRPIVEGRTGFSTIVDGRAVRFDPLDGGGWSVISKDGEAAGGFRHYTTRELTVHREGGHVLIVIVGDVVGMNRFLWLWPAERCEVLTDKGRAWLGGTGRRDER